MRGNSIARAVLKELPHYPGVQLELRNSGRHDRLVITKGEESRFLTIPKTPSDWRSQKNALAGFRRTMAEMGAERAGPVSIPRKAGWKKARGDAAFSLSGKLLALTIPRKSKLLSRFQDAKGKAIAHWRVEVRASPDLSAPPLMAVIKSELPPGKQVAHGLVGGWQQAGGGWRITWSRNLIPALSKLIEFRAADVELYEDKGGELVFKLPAGVLPTAYTPPVKPLSPEPSDAPAVPSGGPGAMEPTPAAAPAKPEAVALGDRPLVLQMPKQAVSIEQAITVLNNAKRRLGHNLRFTVIEDGFLTAVHRIGN